MATASSAPATTAAKTPSTPSAATAAGPAPRARRTPASSAAAWSCRETDWAPMIIAARKAMIPNTPSAIASGLIARWASASIAAVL